MKNNLKKKWLFVLSLASTCPFDPGRLQFDENDFSVQLWLIDATLHWTAS